MANEADSATGLEVDNSYHSVVNSWFGNNDSNKKKNVKDEDSKADEERKGQKSKKKRQSSGENAQDESSSKTSITTGLKKITQNISSFINEKLSKKMRKNKQKQDEKVMDETAILEEKKNHNDDLESDSKTAVISKLSKSGVDAPAAHSVESLKERLESSNLSQSARKRLKKRLNNLLYNTGEKRAPEVGEKATASSPKNSSSPGIKHSKKESLPLKRKLSDNEEVSDQEKEEITPKKRKKTKKRSKQKNIKKDNRPDHLKPTHLQQTADKDGEAIGSDDDEDDSDDDDDSDDGENKDSQKFTKILPSKKADSSKKIKTGKKPLTKKGGKLPQKTEDGKKGKELEQKSSREEAHTVDSLTQRLKEKDLSKATRKRLMRRLLNLKNGGKDTIAVSKNTDGKEKKNEINGDVDKTGKIGNTQSDTNGGDNKAKKRKRQNKEDTPSANDKPINQGESPSSPKKKKQVKEPEKIKKAPVQENTPKKKKQKKKGTKTEDS